MANPLSRVVRSGPALAAAIILLLAGCTGGDGAGGAPERSSPPRPIETRDLGGLPVARAPFCDAIDPERTESVLGGPVTATNHYDNGDEAEITPGIVDVAHEFNCTFAGDPPASVRAWIFARPVSAPQARGLLRELRSRDGCTFPHGLAFGTPTLTAACAQGQPARTVVSVSGLFDDAWLTCEVTLPGTDVEAVKGRAEQWCAGVAIAAGSR